MVTAGERQKEERVTLAVGEVLTRVTLSDV